MDNGKIDMTLTVIKWHLFGELFNVKYNCEYLCKCE